MTEVNCPSSDCKDNQRGICQRNAITLSGPVNKYPYCICQRIVKAPDSRPADQEQK